MRFIALLLFCTINWSMSAQESLFLTGIVNLGNLKRVFIYAYPSDRTYTLQPGKETCGLRLVTIDTQNSTVTLLRGNQTFHLSMGDKEASLKQPLSSFFRYGNLPPEFAGTWPKGYVPEIIRLHKAGMLTDDYALRQSPASNTAAPRYVRALREYMGQLPEDQQAPFKNELDRVTAVHFQNDFLETKDGDPDQANEELENLIKKRIETASPQTLADDANLVAKLINTPAPKLGSRLGTPVSEMQIYTDLLSRQYRAPIRQRIREELLAYASPGGDTLLLR